MNCSKRTVRFQDDSVKEQVTLEVYAGFALFTHPLIDSNCNQRQVAKIHLQSGCRVTVDTVPNKLFISTLFSSPSTDLGYFYANVAGKWLRESIYSSFGIHYILLLSVFESDNFSNNPRRAGWKTIIFLYSLQIYWYCAFTKIFILSHSSQNVLEFTLFLVLLFNVIFPVICVCSVLPRAFLHLCFYARKK